MSRRLVIGKIWDSEYPWDVRVEKICETLTEAGHQVELICRNRDNRPTEQSQGRLRIHRMPFRDHWPRRLERASSFPAFVNPRWYRHALRVFRERGVDLIVCRDLPLAPLALMVGRRIARPVIVDVAEHYPGLVKDLYNRHDFRLVNLILRNPALASLVERYTLPRADGLWVVIEEMGDRLVSLGAHRDRITVVSNTPSLNRRFSRDPGQPRREDGTIRMVYLGIVERSRGLGVVLDALAKLGRAGPVRARLDVFGDGSGLSLLRMQAAELGITDLVAFHGRKPYDEILRQLHEFDVGVIPHHATDHWNYTIQNKLFDYFSAGLPVIVSSMPPAQRVVRETGAGVSFRDRDPEDFLRSLGDLAPAETRVSMGRRGRAAVERTFNWDHDGRRLLASIDRVLALAPSPSRPGAANG